MNGNGWNNMPPTDFSQGQIPHSSGPRAFADNWHTPYQMAAYYAHNQHMPHQAPAHYADNRHIAPQVLAHYVDNMNLQHQTPTYHVDNSHLSYKTPTDNTHLPHPMPTHYADNSHLPHPTPPQYADNRQLPHPIQTHYADNKHLPHPTPTHYAQNTHLPPQTPAHYAQNTHLPPQTPTHYAQNTHLPPQTPAQYADNRHLPHPIPTHYADNKHLPHPTPTHYAQNTDLTPQMPAQYAQNTHLPPQTPAQYADKNHLPHPIPTHYADNKHLPHPTPTHYAQNMDLPPQTLAHYADKSHLPHQTVEHCTDNKHLQHQTQVRYEDKMCLPHPNSEDYADNKCLPHQTPDHYADKRKLSQQTSEACANKRQLSQQTSEACADKRQLPDQTSKQYVDKNLSQQTPKDCADKKCLPQQTPEDCANKKILPQQTPEDRANKKCLPQQTPEDCANMKCLPPLLQCEICELILNPKLMESHIKGRKHQLRVLQLREQSTKHKTSSGEEIRQDQSSQISKEAYAANKCLSQETPDHADKRLLSQQTSEACADKRQLSQQTSEVCADKRQLPDQTSEQYADKNLSQQTPKDCADKKCLPQQTPEDCADKKCLPQQTPEDSANKKCLPSLLHCQICDLKLDPKSMESHYTGKRHRKRIVELSGQSKKCLPANMRCEICDVQFGPKNLKSHNKGNRHKQRLLELREKSKKHKDSNGEEISHIRSSQLNPVVQPKKVPTHVSKRKLRDHTGAKDRDFKVENVKNETSSFKKKNVPVEMSKRKVRDNTDAKDHGFKHEIEGATGGKYMKMNNGIRRSVKNDQPQSTPVELKASAGSNIIAEKEYITCDFAATVIPQGPVASHAFTPPAAVKNHIDLPREVTEAKEHHKVQKCGVVTNDEPQSVSMELQALGGCNISTVAEDDSSDSDAIVISLPQGLVTSQVLSPSPAAGSSFEPPIQINSPIEVEEGTELHEVQNHSVETNDQPHSISMEFHAIAGSAINTPTKGTCSDSGEIVIAPPQSPIAYEVSTPVAVIQTGMSDSKVHNEIQNLIIDSNNQQHLISMELQDVASSITNNQTEVVNSDSTAAEIYKEPHASLLPDAVGSSFEPVTEHGQDTETEPHVSEAILGIESQHPAEETDIELLPPVLMEIDVALEVGAETKTEDGNSQAEMEMDADLSPESGKTKVLKVSVCLTCGDEGFEEAIVYCSQCGDYAMHRYCLAGPVVFTNKVTWFCEDCEEMVVEVDHPNSETPESEKDEVVFDPQPIADPVWRGSFQVFNKSFYKISGLMGHLSTLACPKVLEEATHLPDMLYANLIQRSAVWPESFKKFGTNNQSIGLYFFPESERVERFYDQLVDDMISNDLAIRVAVEKSELLIFSSTWLPRQYKRFQSKYYLWGIFKRKQASCTIKDT